MDFEQAYKEFMLYHIGRRTGERKGRLETRNFHGEKLFLQNIWWPLRGNLDYLHPEYEILDWRGRSYFIDYAWLPPGPAKLLWEIKGFNSHVRDLDRNGFCNEMNRELFLQALGYRVISFAYDDVANRPDLCISLLRMLLSRYQPSDSQVSLTALAEKEVIRLAFHLARPIRPIDITRHLSVDHRTALRFLSQLIEKGLINPVISGNGERIVRYDLKRGIAHDMD
jgi:hypothetical protein